MGGQFKEIIIDGKLTDDQIKREFKEEVSYGQSYNGHQDGYSGDFQTCSGVTNTNKTFDSYAEAETYVQENAQKWENALAVYFYDKPQSVRKYSIPLQKRTNDAEKRYAELEAEFYDSIHTAKSKTIGCKKCVSSINRNYVKHAECPICGHNLMSATQIKRLQVARQKVTDLRNKRDASVKTVKPPKRGVINTMIGAWCAC